MNVDGGLQRQWQAGTAYKDRQAKVNVSRQSLTLMEGRRRLA
jgi:hypothetical protein